MTVEVLQASIDLLHNLHQTATAMFPSRSDMVVSVGSDMCGQQVCVVTSCPPEREATFVLTRALIDRRREITRSGLHCQQAV